MFNTVGERDGGHTSFKGNHKTSPHTAQFCNSSYRNNTVTSLLDQDGEQTPPTQ